ncbi:Transposon Tf2-6 polyprotein [Labeo rohita]|uniref:Gypsy retrotransposon integrase-like protein 1 n=1 Tax=Labeo rohita TaxID=84645 RepID=A0ABQ8L2B6_LABRO|nr:Transposon Tf2-6 polyprotein [Labeo rohita]
MSGPEMVPAELEHLWGVLQQQTMELVNLRQELVGCWAEITALRSETAGLRAECANLRSDLTALQADHDDLAAAQTPPAEPIRQIPPSNQPKISLPDKWDGSGTRCDVFLTNLSLVFGFQPSRYPTDRSRITLLTSLLTGQAAEWATAVLRADGDSAHSYPAFTAELRTAFQHPESEVEVDSRLYHLKQGGRSVSKYTTEFRTLAVQTTWSDAALRTAYYEGLSNRLKDELAVRELPATLEGMIQLALRVDQRMSHSTKSVFRSFAGSTSHQRSPEPSTFHAVAASPPPPPVASEAHSGGDGEPMQIGRTSLSAAERARRYREGLCAYCASPDHHRAICPLRPGNGQTSHYETLVMPFGLCNSPAAFQHFINDVLRDMLVLQRLLAHQLFCKLEKCAFHQHTTTFLGFVISAQGVAMDPQKLEAVRSWPLPTSLKQLQHFLGFANFYRRFIRGFSSTAAPLTALTKPSRGEFHLTPEASQAFKTLCHQFTSAPVLIHPDPARSFVVEVDASDVGVGGVLSQCGPDEKLHPCSFFSRKFNLTQQRYGVGDRELLAIKWALEEWRHWLQGGSDPFTVWPDHQNLTVIRQAKQLNPRQAQWALFFEHFNFHLSYRPGSKNTKADALSRQHQKDTTSSEPAPVLPPHIILAPLRWGLEERVRQGHGQEPPPSDTPTGRLFVPSALRQEVLQWGHDSTLAGHPGVQRTISFISRAFWWRTLQRDIQEYVQACNICARSKTINAPSTGELQPLPVPKRPWTHISLDFVTGLPKSQGKNTILTIVDRFSKAVHLVALSGLPSAKTTAELILEHVVRLHGFPKDIVSDRGPQFTAKFWQAFCHLVGTTPSLSSGFHPQTNGQTERANQQLERYLRCFASEHQRSWASYLVWAELSNNLHTSTTTGLSPFEVCCRFQPPIFEHQEPEVEVPSAQQLVRRCRRLWNHACAAIQKTNRHYIIQHRRRHPPGRLFHVGDRVYLSTRNINLKTDSKKLTSRYIGPFKITHRLNPVTFRLQLPASLRIHPVFHQSQLKPVFFSPLSPQIPAPPPNPGLLTVVLPTPFGESSTRAAVAVASSISSTGKATVRRSGLGFPDGSYWIPLSSRTTVVGYPPLRDSLVPVLEGGTERSQINRVANLLTRVGTRLSSPPRYTGTFPRSFISCLASGIQQTNMSGEQEERRVGNHMSPHSDGTSQSQHGNGEAPNCNLLLIGKG